MIHKVINNGKNDFYIIIIRDVDPIKERVACDWWHPQGYKKIDKINISGKIVIKRRKRIKKRKTMYIESPYKPNSNSPAEWSQWRSQGQGGNFPPGRNSAPLLPPKWNYTLYRGLWRAAILSLSQPPCSLMSPPCRPLILKSLATLLSDPVIEYHHRHHAPGTVPNGKEKNTGPVKRIELTRVDVSLCRRI